MRSLRRLYGVLGAVAMLVLALLPASQAHAELDEAITDRVLPTVVQLGPVLEIKGRNGTELKPIGWGSGTIVSPDGLILTNNHVTDASEMVEQVRGNPNVKVLEGKVAVFLTLRSDDPPVVSFIADVVVASTQLDLAVVRISSDLANRPIDSSRLNLPFLPLGDSDALKNLQSIFVFGYPAIGGATITTVEGTVSGFDRQAGVEGRAWIKTNAAISGGNSGGTTVDRNGNLIGVPTRAAASTTGSPVDCRKVADTNTDGRIDDKDTCVPIGAFINALRPVNLAKPLIDQARTAGTPAPPQPAPNNGQPANTSRGFGPITFATEVDQAGQPIEPNTSFPSGVAQLHGFFAYQGMEANTPFRVLWLANGQVTGDDTYQWSLTPAGNAYVSLTAENGQVLQDGVYELRLSIADQEAQRATVRIGTGTSTQPAPPSPEEGVRLTGQIVDAVSGSPIADAIVLTLKEGITPETFQKQSDQVLDASKTDRNGTFKTTAPLRRDASYGIIIVAAGYRNVEGTIAIGVNDSDILNVQGLVMQRQ